MVHKILTGAGFVLNSTYRETRFLKPPKSTYAVYNDTRTVRGPDNINAIVSHEVNIELYEYAPDHDLPPYDHSERQRRLCQRLYRSSGVIVRR